MTTTLTTRPPAAGLLQLQGLHFAHPGAPALFAGFDVRVEPGVTLLYGDTGSGKTSLLRVIAGELPATGQLTLAGIALADDRAAYQRRVFFGNPSTERFDPLTARATTALLCEGDAAFDAVEWQRLVDGFGLAPHLEKALYMLSTGTRRKLWLAAALASGRPLILLDEPTAALDAASITSLVRALERAAARGTEAIVVASSERLERVPFSATIELPAR